MEVIRPRQHATRRGPAEWFTGAVWIDSISTGPHVRLLSVHFTPGARTAWHRHPFGQTLYVTEGAGVIPGRGGPGGALPGGGGPGGADPGRRHRALRGQRGPLARRRPGELHDPPGDAGDRRRRL